MQSKIFFLISQDLVLLDLAGAVQVFQECSMFGIHYEFKFIGTRSVLISSSGLGFSNLIPFQDTIPEMNDMIFVPGFSMKQDQFKEDKELFSWLQNANEKKIKICSVCTGAFLLAKAGLLDNINCTTHWRFTDLLKSQFPKAKIQTNKLYVKDGNIYTSAGIATGIDLALYIVQEQHGIQLAMNVAKEMVVYLKRNGEEKQQSAYLQYRDHKDEMIHFVQDHIIHHTDNDLSLELLASFIHCSTRNLTRIFKERTGITISEYIRKIRIEKATNLLLHTDYKFDHIANLCGYKSGKQLRNILDKPSYTSRKKVA